jgi:hypothetical protein
VHRSIIHWIFAICTAMGLILLAIALVEPTSNAGGVPHPDYPGMVIGGDGAERLADIGALAFLFQSLLLLLIVCLSILGVSEARRSPKFMAYMAASFIFMIFIWWQMYSSHQQFLETGETGYFLGFPTATAWQVYGTWLCAIPLIVLYSVGFRQFIFSEEDEARFQALLEESSNQA